MVRAYNYAHAKKNRVYNVEAICSTFGVHPNTVTNWRKSGLCSIDEQQPLLFKGSELRRFLKQRKLDQKQQLRLGQFRCFSCKARTWPQLKGWRFEEGRSNCFWASALCPECGNGVQKVISTVQYQQICKAMDSNITPQSLDEDNEFVPGDIVKDQGNGVVEYNAENERIIFEFQKYIERYNVKTQDAYLAAIRDFEEFLQWKPFDKLNTDDATLYRRHLAAQGKNSRSKSSIAHAASQLRRFIDWLTKQEGYRRLNRSIPDYLELSRTDLAGAAGTKDRDFPSINEVVAMISSMPTKTLVQQRDQAIVVASFVFGTRADATASLRIKHVDIDKKLVRQDATEVRTKNSKSMLTCWFPINDEFDQILMDYVGLLRELGFEDEDALFPPDADLRNTAGLKAEGRAPISPWATSASVTNAFKRACQFANIREYTPHSVRHFLTELGREIAAQEGVRKAWSQNLGHETVVITEAHYAKMTTEHRQRLFDDLRNGVAFSEDEKDLLLRFHHHELEPGSPEHKRALELYTIRMARR